MPASSLAADTHRYARCIETSRRVRWDIERDVIRGRRFDPARKFLPDGLAQMGGFGFLGADEQRLVSQVQARSYANLFGMAERFIGAKILESSRGYWLGDQTALEALVRFADEELKHQALFRRFEEMLAACMPAGYRFVADPNAVAGVVLGRSGWSVLALGCLLELVSQAHYRQSLEADAGLDPLWQDLFLFHWKEASQHAMVDELEWRREDARLDAAARDRAVGDLIVLIGALDGILRAQARADAGYFHRASGRPPAAGEEARVTAGLLHAYRWQFILSGVQLPHFAAVVGGLVSPAQYGRLAAALAPLFDASEVPQVRVTA